MEMHQCYISRESARLCDRVLGSQMVSEGPLVRMFERELSDQFGLRNPVCVNSGTSALHLGLVLAGVRPGDEVILPPQTFAATGMAILMCDAVPIFADIDPHTGNLDPNSIGSKINPRTGAVIPVHWAGLPCSMIEIREVIARRRWTDIYEVEDAAHALGAMCKGEPIGKCNYSRFCCFSFQAIKHLTTGDGGALCSWGGSDMDEAKVSRWFGIDREQEPGLLGEREQLLPRIGFKYHMNDVAAAIGLGNLHGLKERLQRRQVIGKRYREELEGVPGLQLTRLDPDRTHAYWIFPLLVDRRDDFVRTLKGKGIPCSVVNRRIDRHPIFGGLRDLPGAAEFDQKQINLPCHPGLTDADVSKVIETIKGGW